MRTCVGCRQRAPADGMMRVAAGPDGTLVVSRTATGRGAWLCAGSLECVEQASRRSALGRALRTEVSPAALVVLRTRIASRGRMVAESGDEGSDGEHPRRESG